MMAKITKGSSFGGCVRYVMNKKDAELIAADGVLLDSVRTVTDSFCSQAGLNPRLGKMVGHISLNFSAEDKDSISNAFMLKAAEEYMNRMGIVDTQYIIVRHRDRDYPHCHIVFNRVSNSGKTISDRNDRHRSVKACRALTEKYGLYLKQTEAKQNVKRESLRGADKIRYEIYDAVKGALPLCSDWGELIDRLKNDGISVTYKFKGATGYKEGVVFAKDGHSFSGSKVDRQYSYSKLDAVLNENARKFENRIMTTFHAETGQNSQGFTHAASHNYSGKTENSCPDNHSVSNVLDGLFNFHVPDREYYEDESEFISQQRKKKKKRGRSL